MTRTRKLILLLIGAVLALVARVRRLRRRDSVREVSPLAFLDLGSQGVDDIGSRLVATGSLLEGLTAWGPTSRGKSTLKAVDDG